MGTMTDSTMTPTKTAAAREGPGGGPRLEAREDAREVGQPHRSAQGFGQRLTVVRRHRQVAPFIEGVLGQTRPTAVDPPAAHAGPQKHHHAAVAVVGAAVAVLLDHAAELGHHDDERVRRGFL
jgi:hypothetical protein